jgi:methionyl-tRNA synthetase
MKKLPAKITFLSSQGFSDFKTEVDKLADEAESAMQELDFQKAFTKIERIVYLGNHNLSTHEFWQLVKSSD